MTDTTNEFWHTLRVRYAETDAGGVAHHSSYIAWFEEARTEWIRMRGTPYAEIEAAGTYLMVAEMHVRYLSPALYDDELAISVRVKERKRATLELAYDIRRKRDRLPIASATTKLAATDREGKVRRLPDGV